MKPHKHAELIKAWADGAEIEYWHPTWEKWVKTDDSWMLWADTNTFRIKPEPNHDVVRFYNIGLGGGVYQNNGRNGWDLKLTFDGGTGELKSAQALK